MNFTIQLEPTTVFTEIDGKTVLFSRKTGDFFGLNSTANYLVKKLLESDFEATTKTAAQDFQAEISEISQDLKEIVEALVKAKLVTRTAL